MSGLRCKTPHTFALIKSVQAHSAFAVRSNVGLHLFVRPPTSDLLSRQNKQSSALESSFARMEYTILRRASFQEMEGGGGEGGGRGHRGEGRRG